MTSMQVTCSRLNRREQQNGGINLDEHMYFICPECGKGNDTEPEFWRHLDNNHDYARKYEKELNFIKMDGGSYKCLTCSILVPYIPESIRTLQVHSFLHLPYTECYRCRLCCMSFTLRCSLAEHLCEQHGFLMARIGQVKQLQQEKEATVSENPLLNSEFYLSFLCPLCGSHFERFNPWLEHIDTVHIGTSADLRIYRIGNTANYFCTVCKFTLEGGLSREQRQRHHFTHLFYPSYFQCALCNTCSAYKSEILLHFIKAHPSSFQRYKEYIKIPVEWGGDCANNVLSELDQLLNGNDYPNANDNEHEHKSAMGIGVLTDALKNNSIDFAEDDVESATTQGISSPIEPSSKQMNFSANLTDEQSFEASLLGELRADTTNDGNRAVPDGNVGDSFNEIIPLETTDDSLKGHSDIHPHQSTNFNKHATDYAKYMNFVCQECQRKFKNSSNCQEHIVNTHKIVDMEAEMRSMDMQSSSRYSVTPKCVICAKGTFKTSEMVQHIQVAHGKEIMVENTAQITNRASYNCPKCCKKYRPDDPRIAIRKQCDECGATLNASLYDINDNNKMFERLTRIGARLQKTRETQRKSN